MYGSTVALLVLASVAGVVVASLRGIGVRNRSLAQLWMGFSVSLLVAIAYLVALKAKLVPVTVINFGVIVLGIIYFGVVECMRIHRSIAMLQR